MSLERIEDKNIKRTSALVVRIERGIKRTIEALNDVDQKRTDENARHLFVMDTLHNEETTLRAERAELKSDLAEAKQYLQEITKAANK